MAALVKGNNKGTMNTTNRPVEGWQLSGTELWRTGVPMSIDIGYDRALLSNNFDAERPNVIAGCNEIAGQSALHWFNPACFTLPVVGTVGNLGKNYGYSAGLRCSGLLVVQGHTALREGQCSIPCRGFQYFNHTLNAFTAVGGLTGRRGESRATFQTPSILGTSRQIQLALKFLF
jgi:hypothetical protein